ncbi:MAG: heparinase II/III family protein [Acidobacteria bacterium]|nr:heparinase II/III family protein [Acidobacteriota bacterium]
MTIRAAILIGLLTLPAAGFPDLTNEDPREGNLGGWASYPPVQDAGYDPSLTPASGYDAPGRQSLMRIVRPASAGPLRFGFIKRLDRIAAGKVRVSFNCRLKPDVPGSLIEIGIAGETGRRYTVRQSTAPSGWSRASAEFGDIPQGAGLEALYIIVIVPGADPEVDYRFLMNEVMLEAPRKPAFELLTPRAVSIPPWKSLVATSTYAPGETISIEARAPVPLKQVRCVLKDQDGHVVSTINLSRQGELWRGPSFHAVALSDPTGVWRIELLGTTLDGKKVTNEVRVIVRPPRRSTHPRLYFSAGDRPALLARTQAPGLRDTWNHLLALAAASRAKGRLGRGGMIQSLDTRYLLPSLPAYFDVVQPVGDQIRLNSLRSYMRGDPEARSDATAALLQVAGWRRWAPPWFEAHGQHTYYPAGELSGDVAFAYDLLYENLPASERALVRNALLERGIKDAYKEYVLDDRLMAGTSNWIGHSVGGGLVAAMAVVEDQDDPQLNTLVGGLLLKLEDHLAASYLSDGSYGESVGYEQFDLKSTTQALEALSRVWGIDYWKHSFVKDALRFPLYTLALPAQDSPDLGDGKGQNAYSSASIVRRSADPAVHWYYRQFAHESISDFLFPPSNITGSAPSQPASYVFDRKGSVVFRSGWGAGDAMLLFRAGPNFNHNHADQGAFILRAFGEDFAAEGGPSDYYKDPYYHTYFTQAAAHNTILVDGDPASQDLGDTAQFKALDMRARLTDAITSPSYDAAAGELSAVYRGRLELYRRRIVFLKPGFVVIYDDLKTSGPPARFDWLLHVKDSSRLRASGAGYIYQGIHGAMGVHPLYPERVQFQVRKGHLPFAVFNPAAPRTVPAEPGILSIQSGESSTNGRFLVVLNLVRDARRSAQIERLEGTGCVGTKLGPSTTFFRHSAAATAQYADWKTDAETWTVSDRLLSAGSLTSLSKGGNVLFQSDHPASFSAEFDQGQGSVHLTVSAAQPISVRFFTGFPQDGRSESGKTMELKFAAGQHQMSINR